MRHVLILPVILMAWLGIAAAAMLPGTIDTAMVPASTPIPKSIAIVGKRGPFLIVKSDNKDYVRDLYRLGAGFVLPARKSTCLTLQNV